MAGGLRKRRRMQLVVLGAGLLAVATALVGTAMRDGIEFFRSPSQVAAEPPAAGERFRLGGLVAEGSVVREGGEVRFVVTDGGGTVPVSFRGIPPDLFREGQGVVATGAIEGGTFVASEILAKHDERYMPKEVADALKEQGMFHPDGPGAADPGS
jgi:cytochrome c-type biogenesis protein CcmE